MSTELVSKLSDKYLLSRFHSKGEKRLCIHPTNLTLFRIPHAGEGQIILTAEEAKAMIADLQDFIDGNSTEE